MDVLRQRGASFFNELAAHCPLDVHALRAALGELVASGLAASDGFSGLRALLIAFRAPRRFGDRRATFAGRWTLLATTGSAESGEADVEALAWTLLRRYGVVFRRVLTRESHGVPWRELVRVYRRLEARGEIRGGRFVTGMAGEQFALPDAVERLREIRRSKPDGRLTAISTADPLNLAGIITPGDRLRAASRNRVVYRNGVPVAVREGDFVRELIPLDAELAGAARSALKAKSRNALHTQ